MSVWVMPTNEDIRRRQVKLQGRICTSVYLEKDMHKRVTELAKQEGVAVSHMIVKLAEQAMSNEN